MFDLAKTNISEMSEVGHRFELVLPEVNKPTGAFVTVRGDNSKTVKDFARKQYEALQAKAKQARRRNKDPEDMSLQEAEDMAVESAYVRLIGWEGIGEKGKLLEFNEENAKRILKEHTWIRQAVLDEAGLLAKFVD